MNLLQSAFHKPSTQIYRYVQGFIWVLIVLSIIQLAVEFGIPKDSPARPLLQITDRVLLIIFAIELVLRVVSYYPASLLVFHHPPLKRLQVHLLGRLRFLTTPLILVDILAVLALFPGLRGLRVLRLLRLLRTTNFFQYRNPFAIVWLAFEESRLLFYLAFLTLFVTTVLGGVSFYLVELNQNPNLHSVLDGIWWALVTITTVGYGDITPVSLLGRVIGGIVMVTGMFTLALFAGIVGSSLVKEILSIREEQFRMSDYTNHIVVCGYDQSTRLLLDALKLELELNQTCVVLFDIHERPRNLPPEFLWVQGDPTKESELDKVRLIHAATVIVSGERDTTPQIADARTILTVFTIRSYLRKFSQKLQMRRTPLYILAEILDSENVDHAKTSGADEVIETRKIGFSMIAHAVKFHGVATMMSRVLISGAHSVYIGKIPGEFQEVVKFGELMAELQLSDRGGLVVGVQTETGEEIMNPQKDLDVRPGTMLLYMAREPLLEPPV